jgi:hypothetical protein
VSFRESAKVPATGARSRSKALKRLASAAAPGSTNDLAAYECRVMSQQGEDGIVHEILRRAGFPTRRSVELGCGTNGGNSGLLAACFGYSSLMVDGSARNATILRRNLNGTGAKVVEAWVTRENVNDVIVESDFSGAVDHLGIDLDGNDYWIWDAVEACDPLLVVAEYNAQFGPSLAVTVPYDPQFSLSDWKHAGRPPIYFGASIAALAALGRKRGFRLVGGTSSWTHNAFFLKERVCPEIGALVPEDAWNPNLKSSLAERWRDARVQLAEEGVLEYFDRRGWSLVEVA